MDLSCLNCCSLLCYSVSSATFFSSLSFCLFTQFLFPCHSFVWTSFLVLMCSKTFKEWFPETAVDSVVFICHILFSPDQSVEAPEAEESGDQLTGWEKTLRVSRSPGQPICAQRPASHHPPGQTAVQLTVWIQYVSYFTLICHFPLEVLFWNMKKLGKFC